MGILAVLSAIVLGTEIVKEAVEPVAPANRRFDWDAYYEDIRNGMSVQEQIKKRAKGGYYTTKPIPPDSKWK